MIRKTTDPPPPILLLQYLFLNDWFKAKVLETFMCRYIEDAYFFI